MPYIERHPHLDDAALRALAAGEMGRDGRMQAAAHLACCAVCMERFIALTEENAAPEPPRGLQERILLPVAEQAQKRREFYRYCLRVAVSSAAAIVLAFGVFTPEAFHLYATEAPPETPSAVTVLSAPPPEMGSAPAPTPEEVPEPLFLQRLAALICGEDGCPVGQINQQHNGE